MICPMLMQNVLTQFNTPKIKYNLSIGNYSIQKVFGFNITYRWQDSYRISVILCFRYHTFIRSARCADQYETSKTAEQHD